MNVGIAVTALQRYTKPMQHRPILKKLPANAVPYGDSISTRGGYIWCAFDGDQLVCTGATAKEARTRYMRLRTGTYGRVPMTYPTELEGRRDKPQPITDADLEAMGLKDKSVRGGGPKS